MYKKLQNKKIKFIFGLILLISLNFSNFLSFLTPINRNNNNFKELKSSGVYYDIVIDDFPGSLTNWAWAQTQPWFGGGSGSPGDPYIIEDHTFEYSSGSGDCFYIMNSRKYFIINNCTFRNSFLLHVGLFLVNVTNGQILNSYIYNSVADGIELLDTSEMFISNNHIYDNAWSGIYMHGISENNTITGNFFNNNGWYGVEVYSSNNLLYNNYFTNPNSGHAEDNGVNNDWNSTIIGNYWDDYTGYDMDLDGIGDDPYDVPPGGGSQDYLPIWNLQEPIAINDLGGADYTWAEAALEPWCTGAGTSGDPYVIEDLIIDGKGIENCISVQNSNKYFMIQNCKVYNSGTVFFASGILLFNVTNSQIIGNNASNNEFIGITLLDCENNIISGNFANNNTLCGIILADCHNNTISGNIANENINEHGIYLAGSHNNSISGNFAIDNGAYGIMLEASSYNSLSGNSLINNTNSGIYLLDSSNNNTITGTIANYNDNNGIYCVNSKNNTIQDTIASYNKHNGIYLQNSNNTRILRNELSESIENGIKMESSHENWIEGTVANDNGFNGIYSGLGNFNIFKDTVAIGNGHNGIYLQNTNNCTLSDNNLSNSTENGLKMDFCTENWIIGTIANDNIFDGIYGLGAVNNTIKDTSANDNGHNGIFLQISNDNIIKQNDLFESDENGIKLEFACLNNIIYDNYLFKNVLNGIFLAVSTIYNIIYENVISDNNDNGIYIASGCSDNLFYKNFFLDNGNHAIDDGLNNDWNSTTVGNYWDNWTSPDLSPNDGIVDYPYNISGSAGSVDYFPIADDSAPSVTINSPSDDDLFGIGAPNYDVTITDNYLFQMWYTLDGGLHNYTFTEFIGTIDQSVWESISDGMITLTFYASDKAGNIGSSGVNIEKDTQAPSIIINSPNTGDTYGVSAPSFIVEISDDNLDSMWYSLDGGLTNFTFTNNG
ncbi:MAG: nitrous oxide reductase family maturation protein NosD, partial [Candidatus Hodarchaeota archaeon]